MKPSLAMTVTSLKLPESLKRRIAFLAAIRDETPHAFMVAAINREVSRMELRERFKMFSKIAESESMSTGRAFPLDATFDYLEAQAAGEKPERPRSDAWRGWK